MKFDSELKPEATCLPPKSWRENSNSATKLERTRKCYLKLGETSLVDNLPIPAHLEWVTSAKITPEIIRSWKGVRRFGALTAYDYPMARWLDEAGVPLLLVGDSVGMVVLGHPNTTHVSMNDMEHHVRAAARAKPNGCLGGDLPYRSYETPAAAVLNAQRLVAAGAEFVKAEGGREIEAHVRAITAAGIHFCGHLGMLPQHILEEGAYRIKGRTDSEHERLISDARLLAAAGAFAVVLELVTPPVACEITRAISIPTIGIGSGPDCDGQILVTSDLIGGFPWFTPRFVKPRVQTVAAARQAVAGWLAELSTGQG